MHHQWNKDYEEGHNYSLGYTDIMFITKEEEVIPDPVSNSISYNLIFF